MPVFFARLRKVEEANAAFKQEQRETLRQMAGLLEDKAAAEAELARALAEYEELKERHREKAERLRADAAAMLSVRQRCQFAVFEERFRSELRDMITRVREVRAGMRMDERREPRGPRSH
jgi:hypothetical protein